MQQDVKSFLAGERAALGRAFRETLPSQQALGVLSNGVAHVGARLAEEAAHVRELQAARSDMGATLQVGCCSVPSPQYNLATPLTYLWFAGTPLLWAYRASLWNVRW